MNIESARSRRIGTVGYARILAAMPGTCEQIAGKTGVNIHTVQRLTQQMNRLGVAHRQSLVSGHRCKLAVWQAGPGESVPGLHVPAKSAPQSQMIAFASMIRAIQEPSSVVEIKEETGLDHRTIREAIKILRAAKLAHIGGWIPNRGNGTMCFKWGRGPDKPKPPRLSRGVVVKVATAIGRLPAPSIWAYAEAA